jgi:hypothetical protein
LIISSLAFCQSRAPRTFKFEIRPLGYLPAKMLTADADH